MMYNEPICQAHEIFYFCLTIKNDTENATSKNNDIVTIIAIQYDITSYLVEKSYYNINKCKTYKINIDERIY
jgi:hypothetical protein